jgi:hypothetical protein
MNYDVYCDESGNSGGNYLDPQQPFYVLAGWMIERGLKYRAENRISLFRKEHFPDKLELKGAEILKSNKGQALGNILLTELGQANCTPFFIIAEKRYCVAAKMVEAFLDSEHNERVSPSFSWMNGLKKDIAQIIYDISESSIKKFAFAHKSPSLETLRDAQQTLITELYQNGYFQLAKAIEGSSKYMQHILEEEAYSMNAMPNKAMHSLNLPTFTAFLQLIEKFTRKQKIKKVRMFHDDTKQFKEAYPEAFNWYASIKKENVEFILQNGTTILSSLKSLQVFGLQESKNSLMIQGADVLASFINLYCTKTMLNKKISPELKKFGEFLMGSLIANDLFMGEGFNDVISSDDFLRKVAINAGMNIEQKNNEKPLKNLDFSPHIFI